MIDSSDPPHEGQCTDYNGQCMCADGPVSLQHPEGTTLDISYTDCTPSGSHGKLKSVTWTPNPPSLGDTVNLVSDGTIDEQVTGGSFEVTATTLGRTLLDVTKPVCGDSTIELPLGMGTITVHGLTCPQAPGEIKITQSVKTPTFDPLSKVSVKVNAKEQNGQPLLCVNATITKNSAAPEKPKTVEAALVPHLVFASPANNQTHYGNGASCEADEVTMTITGVQGKICAPKCDAILQDQFRACCPSDKPAGVTANPQCALKDATGNQYCALICSPSLPIQDQKAADAQCGTGASCKAISGTGVCTYDTSSTATSGPVEAASLPGLVV